MTEQFDALNPQVRQWWVDHLASPVTVVLKCGRGQPRCGKRVGEVKRDGEQKMVLRNMIRPEPTVPDPRQNWTARSAEELRERAAEREQHVLRRFDGEGGRPMEVMKQRRDLPDALGPLEMWSSYTCPVHGEVRVDAGELGQFVDNADDTQSLTQRTFWLS